MSAVCPIVRLANPPRASTRSVRTELATERTRAVVAEERVAAREAVIAELRAELARLRRPWWQRWTGL